MQLWFQDEARFGQQGTNSRIWAEKGSDPRAPRQTAYEYAYLFGAACPHTGETNCWILPRADTKMMNIQLQDLSRQIKPDVHILLVLDRAGWHLSHDLSVPENITLCHLPPYSPELNPIELIWRFLKQRFLSNRIYQTLDELIDELDLAWKKLKKESQRITSLCFFPWIKSIISF